MSMQGRLRRHLTVSVMASCIGTVMVAIVNGISLPLLLVHLGATGLQIGLIAASQQLGVLAQMPACLLVEHAVPRREFWGITATIHRLLWFVPPVLLLIPGLGNQTRIWVMLGAIALSATMGHAACIPWFSWMADLVPGDVSGRFWGIRQAAVMSVFIVATWAVGEALDRYSVASGGGSMTGFVVVFTIAAAMGVADILLHWTVPDPCPAAAGGVSAGGQLRQAWRDADFRWFTCAMAAWMFGMGATGPFSAVYLKSVFSASYTELSVMAVAGALGSLVCGIPAGRLVDRIGARTMAALMMFAGPVTAMVPWFLIDASAQTRVHLPFPGLGDMPLWLAIIAPFSFVVGMMFSVIGICQIQLVSLIAPKFGRMLPLAAHWSAAGISAAMGALAGGLIMDLSVAHKLPGRTFSGMPVSYLHVLVVVHAVIGAFVASPSLRRVSERGRGMEGVRELLRASNPLRIRAPLLNIFPFGQRPDAGRDGQDGRGCRDDSHAEGAKK